LSAPQSVARLIHILEALCASAVPVGLAQLSRAIRAPKSSVAALMRGLTEAQIVVTTEAGYRLGPGAFGLGSALMEARRRLQSSDLVRAGMRRLAERSGETVLLAVRDARSGMMTYVDTIESRNAVRFAVTVGDRRPLYCTAGGRALLAAESDKELRRIFPHADQQNIREAILKHCSRFPDEYWLERDREGVFPHDFYKSMVEAGWLGIAMPTEFGGSGLGITEAAVMMQAIAESGAGMSGASSVTFPVFSLQPVVLFGTRSRRSASCPRSSRRGPGVLRGHRAQCGAQHHRAEDPRRTPRRRLSGQRREDLDLHRAGREQDAAAGAHHAARRGQAQDRRAVAVLYRASIDPRSRCA
jgi:DNA-binding IclR family transcriptional regulator